MPQFKEMVIRRPRIGTMPMLELQGKWLETYGFTVGISVSIKHQDSCLTLTTHTTPPNHLQTLQVTSKLIRKRPRTHLVLEWWLLRKYGFHVGDRVGLTLTPNQIQISKINRFMVAEVA
jgi:hypothetical protein